MRPKEVTDFLRCGGMNCDGSCECSLHVVGDCMTARVHDYVIDLERRVPQWSSVKENPPREGECVFCYFPHKQYGSKIMVDYNQAGEGATPHFSNQALWGRCTHWMPLPSTEGLHDD